MLFQCSKLTAARRAVRLICSAIFLLIAMAGSPVAHPLGQFTINHFSRLEVGTNRVNVRYVVDMAEIPAFQELQAMGGSNGNQVAGAELDAYMERAAARYADGLLLTIDGERVPLQVVARRISLLASESGLSTLRIECDFAGDFAGIKSAGGDNTANQTRRLKFEDTNYRERAGWRETVVVPAAGVAVFDTTAFGTPLTDELKVYPEDLLAAPLDERAVELSFTNGAAPANAALLRARDGRSLAQSRDRFAELISVRDLTPTVALFGLLVAAALGALHAFSPGHGKTVVGAYLVGSRGTAKHAAFLGLTVTVTHTAGVFALGLVTLFASQYIVPERLFPILGVVSGGIVLVMGLSLFASRLLAALGLRSHDHGHTHGDEHASDHTHDATHGHTHDHPHDGDPTVPHSHGGGRIHTHLPPGTDGSRVTWRSLLALGISGGLLPCPSALVVLLSAISLHRVGYGMLLVVAFSVGLAVTLTGIGLAFVYAGRFILSRAGAGINRLARVLPVVSALVVACLGAALCYEALGQAGIHPGDLISSGFTGGETQAGGEQTMASMGAWAVLGLGLVFGLKHATEVDHIVAVTTIVSEQRNLLRAALVGALWGAGHTVSLIAVGIVVLTLRVAIPELVSDWLEFGVALMIIGLGLSAFVRVLRRRRPDVHVHEHVHDDGLHAHIHFHEEGTQHADSATPHTHAVTRPGLKPVLVGAMHGLAGSAALTLLVLTQIASPLVGLLYLFVFGVGSVFGMLLMSCLVGLPFVLGAHKLTRMNFALQATASVLSIAFGLWYAYEIHL
ncbi:MAG: sulfite exporter TauE/SafE family protein [Acidobacteria bacterium]|nr:sulfite exporter TauE/SafE family protein [Acidobacteriota bacterium]